MSEEDPVDTAAVLSELSTITVSKTIFTMLKVLKCIHFVKHMHISVPLLGCTL